MIMNSNNESFQNEIINMIRQIVGNQQMFEEKISQIMINQTALDASYDNLKYEIYDEIINSKEKMQFPKLEPIDDTIDKIMHGKSMCRFGDGEFAIMSGRQRQKFQLPSKKMQDHLIKVFESNDENIIIGIADNYGSLSKYNADGKYNIRIYLNEEIRKEHYSFIDMNRVYANAYITRPYAMYADNMTDAPRKRFEKLRQIWDGREILIIEGEKTRMGIGNDLFDNANDIKRIICPAVSAYDRYEEILEKVLEQDKDRLVLIALGPTASILAYDMAKTGYQALDIGHIDLEYDWMRAGTGEKVDISYKYVNEIAGGDVVEDIVDEKYDNQIIAKVL